MEDIIWQTEKRKARDLKFFPDNPRMAGKEDWENLEKSLDKFNLAEPLVINTDNTVIGGNFRLKILQAKGIEEVDVRVPSRTLTEEESRELNLRLNKNQGLWDLDLLANFDEELLKEVGFENEELQTLAVDLSSVEGNEDREKKFKNITITCPHCQKSFEIKV